MCQPISGNLQNVVEISSSVEFVDASEPALSEEAVRLQLNARVPEDFFYPFT